MTTDDYIGDIPSRENSFTKRTLNMSRFTEQFSNNHDIPNPEVKVEKMLKKLINFFHEVFLEFDTDEQKVNGDKVLDF